MTRLAILITKGVKADTVAISRPGAPAMSFDFPKKGPIPHDAMHLFVEGALGITRGFWGMVVEGVDPVELQEIAKAAGHASSMRAKPPEPHIVELIQAERLVECFEAELWSPGADAATLRDVAETACAASHVPCPILPDTVIDAIRTRIAAFAGEWRALKEGQRMEFRWPEGPGVI